MKAKRLFLVILFLELQFMVSSVLGVPFYYPDFSSITDIDLVGDAIHIPAENRIRLTPAVDFRGGAAWYNTPVPVVSEWETVFEFQIGDTSSPSGADGIAFLIQNDSVSALGLAGGYMGYEGITHSLAVEFDTWYNGPLLGDPDDNHISVQTRGISANSANHTYSRGATSLVPVFENGAVYTVKISYVPGTLTIFVDDLFAPVLTVPGVNLGSLLDLSDGKAWVGFTAATGAQWENQDILSWSFVPEPATLSLLGLGSLVLLRKRRA